MITVTAVKSVQSYFARISRLFIIAFGTTSVALPTAAHDVFPTSTDFNSPSGEAERSNAKLLFLSKRAHAEGVGAGPVEAAQSIYDKRFIWTKQKLRVCFWNGLEADQRDIMALANVWHDAVPILSFDFEQNGKVRVCQLSDLKSYKTMADIRISLDAADTRPLWFKDDQWNKTGDWSYPGLAVAQDSHYPTTMSLAGAVELHKTMRMTNYVFNVRHEFGHALGLVHEHQRSVCDGWFNIPQIAKDENWTVPFAQAQVGALADTSNLRVIGSYDVNSIMQYNFPLAWYMPDHDGQKNPCRRSEDVDDLSDLDKTAIAQLYQPDLNETPQRVALLSQAASKVSAAAAPVSAAPVNPTAKQSVEAALVQFKDTLGNSPNIQIQVFLHRQDKDVVLKAVSNLGYPVKDASGNQVVSLGHRTASLTGDPTNAVLFTPDVSGEDVRYIALSLLNAGLKIKSIEPYYPAVTNHYQKRTHLVQIGADVNNRTREPLTADQILTGKLPMFATEKVSSQPSKSESALGLH